MEIRNSKKIYKNIHGKLYYLLYIYIVYDTKFRYINFRKFRTGI